MSHNLFGLVVRFDLKPESVDAFDSLVAETVDLIKAKEPNTLLYVCHAVEGAECARIFYEIYLDRSSFDFHESQEHTKRFLTEREPYLAKPPRVELFDSFSGKNLPRV